MSNSSDPQNALLLLPMCLELESTLLHSPFGHILLYGQMPLLLLILISIGFLLHQYFQQRIVVHGNLLLLFANIVAIYFITTLGIFCWLFRYRLLLFFYSNPCELLTPLWMVCLFYGPTVFQNMAYPAFHFCIMIERFRATILADKYEGEGQKLGIWMATIIWLISAAFTGFVVGVAFGVEAMAIQGMPYITSSQSATPYLVVQCAALALTIGTALGDWRITRLNNKIREISKSFANYSLARNYQLNENSLTMRLILPMDTAYALLYSVYLVLAILLRVLRPSMTSTEFSCYYNMNNTLLYLYAAICMIVYIRFIKFIGQCQKGNVEVRPRLEEAKIHFKQLHLQWNEEQKVRSK